MDINDKIFGEIQRTFGGRLRLIITGAAAISPEVVKDFKTFGIPVYLGYGLTECSPLVIGNNDRIELPDSVGVPLPGVEAKIINADASGVGEICVKGPMVMLGYYNDPEATAEVLDEDGFFHTGDLGTVDENGVFTAAAQSGSGNLTVSAGGRSVTIPVTVSGHIQELDSFETDAGLSALASTATAAVNVETSSDLVRYGQRSVRVDYNASEGGTATVESNLAIPSGERYLGLWVYGDGSGNILSLLYNDGAAGYQSLQVTPLDFTGWKQVTVTLPGAHFEIQGLQVSATTAADGTVSVGDKLSGTIYIDHITATASGTPDNAAPVVSASLDNSLWQVTASVADAVDGILPAGSVTVTYNGAPYGSYDPATGLVTVALPGPGESHEAMRITITARDLSGNIGRASVDVEPYGVDHKFTDINDYWAATYVDFLYNANITTGYADGTFRPNDNISRQQFAVMLYRYLGLDGTQYESVTLPFADNASIGDYALTAVKALYTEGIINGSTGSDGRLYFNPGGSLTRAQAAAMIGRTQEKGYAIVDLTFSDTASIPAYATYYIQTMAAQGVISGYADGTFQPGANITRGQMAKILYNLM